MKKNVFIFAITLSFLIFITGCANTANSNSKDLEIAQLKEEIVSYENEISQLKEENEDYKTFVDSSIESLDKDEITALAKNCWSYGISVDDAPMNFNDVNQTENSNFKITISEKMNVISAVEEKIFESGAISGNFYDHLTFIDIQPTKTYITDGTVVQGMNYEFENVPKGSVIKIQVTDELKERLGLEDNVISIEVD